MFLTKFQTSPYLSKLIAYSSLFCVMAGFNECLFSCFSSRVITTGWAMACVWVLVDGMSVATQLTYAELALQDLQRRNEALQTENGAHARSDLGHEDMHRLLCEIRQRMIRLTKHHHTEHIGHSHNLGGSSENSHRSSRGDIALETADYQISRRSSTPEDANRQSRTTPPRRSRSWGALVARHPQQKAEL